MNIAFGAAKGLEKLHQVNPPIIHRDFKSDNILLSLDFEPKVSDFGSAKIAPAGDTDSRQRETVGYMAPEVSLLKPASIRSDIYSFGLVLLELITGAKAIDSNREGEERSLAARARSMLNDKNFEELIDPMLPGCVPEFDDLMGALAVAEMCIMKKDVDRPDIGEVVLSLSSLVYRSHDSIGSC